MSKESQDRELSGKKYKKNCTLVVPGLLEFPTEDRRVDSEYTSQFKELEVYGY